MTKQEMLDKKIALVKQARELNDSVAKENRAMTQEEENKWDALRRDIEKMSQDIKAEERRLSLLGFEETAPQSTQEQEERQQETPEQKEERQMDAFRHFLRTRQVRTDKTGLPLLALDNGTDTGGGTGSAGGGGVWAPQKFFNELIRDLEKEVKILPRVRTITLKNTTSIGIPVQSADATDAGWTSEIPISQDKEKTWAFSTREMSCYRLAKEIVVSNKQLLASIIDIDSMIRGKLAEVMGRAIENALLTGDGDKKPLGIFHANAFGTEETSRDLASAYKNEFASDDLIKVKGKLRPGYRDSAVWLFHPDVLTKILLMKDANGQYIWRPGLVAGEPDRLLGLPIIESEFAPNTVAGSAFIGALGNFSYYWLTRLQGMGVQVLRELYAERNMTAYLCDMYLDGAPIQKEAFARLCYGTATKS